MKLLVFLVVVAIALKVTEGGRCDPGRQYEHQGLCCPKCRPGQYVKRNCTGGENTTICATCEPGTFMITWNEKSSCDSCPNRKYYHNTFLICWPCLACTKGQYPAKKCTGDKNTICQRCPENHFSNISANYDQPCVPCRKCKAYERKCTSEEDAECAPAEDQRQTTDIPSTQTTMDISTTREITIVTEETTSPVKNGSQSSTNNTTLMILAIVISLIIMGTLPVIYWCARRKSRCQGSDRFAIIPRSLKYEPLRTGLLLRQQPAWFFLKLVELLTPDNRPNWKDLAAEFGDFTWDEIATFAVDKNLAAEKMLCAWQTKNTSTVDRLHQCLMTVNREDVATYVAQSVSDETHTMV